ncbi:MAG: hypothetical protein LBS68_01240 [Puniceicoccales bacterium]|nr:hypothetical protein [Puniceicoccales bacterium]
MKNFQKERAGHFLYIWFAFCANPGNDELMDGVGRGLWGNVTHRNSPDAGGDKDKVINKLNDTEINPELKAFLDKNKETLETEGGLSERSSLALTEVLDLFGNAAKDGGNEKDGEIYKGLGAAMREFANTPSEENANTLCTEIGKASGRLAEISKYENVDPNVRLHLQRRNVELTHNLGAELGKKFHENVGADLRAGSREALVNFLEAKFGKKVRIIGKKEAKAMMKNGQSFHVVRVTEEGKIRAASVKKNEGDSGFSLPKHEDTGAWMKLGDFKEKVLDVARTPVPLLPDTEDAKKGEDIRRWMDALGVELNPPDQELSKATLAAYGQLEALYGVYEDQFAKGKDHVAKEAEFKKGFSKIIQALQSTESFVPEVGTFFRNAMVRQSTIGLFQQCGGETIPQLEKACSELFNLFTVPMWNEVDVEKIKNPTAKEAEKKEMKTLWSAVAMALGAKGLPLEAEQSILGAWNKLIDKLNGENAPNGEICDALDALDKSANNGGITAAVNALKAKFQD